MKYTTLPAIFILLASCASVQKHGTLGDIDIRGNNETSNTTRINGKNQNDIRAAYAEYLKHASKDDVSRIDALQRLAQLEFELTEKLEKNKGIQNDKTQDIEDKIYDETLDRSIDLLKTTLHDYPKAKDRDKTLYQLAKAYDQRGLYDRSIATLQTLVKAYPSSRYYVESKFRLAEDAFSQKKYSLAEDTYTDVIVSPKNSEYLEKALYKRGWARFKQAYYEDAIEDFLRVVNLHDFKEYKNLSTSEKNQFDEYFRAIGLSFSYLGGAESLDSYFKQHPGFHFIYHTYANVSDIYLKQQRFTDAADTLDNFISNNPKSPRVPAACMKILHIWKSGGFTNKLIPALDRFYTLYHPQSIYWSSHQTVQSIYESVTNDIRQYIILAATHYHKEYMSFNKESSFDLANKWYKRYLKYYSANSRKDNIYMLYAELLSHHKNKAAALGNYELAAYDSGVILNKDAAYSTILLADQLYSSSNDPATKSNYLNKLIKYSLMYTHLYPNDPNSIKIITRASQQAYNHGIFDQAVKLTELYSGKSYTKETYNINLIKANTYFKLKQYQDAEAAYTAILQHYRLDETTKTKVQDNQAVSIYKQGKAASDKGDIEAALNNYARIYKVAPETQTASAGLYDAIVLCMTNKLWQRAIGYSRQFQAAYPTSSLSPDVAKKLSAAYLNSHQDLAAANELVKISHSDKDASYKMAALWKAGELYESKHETSSAIRSFAEYARTYTRPFPQYMESMQKLSTLYTQSNNPKQANYWRKTILSADKRTPGDLKTDRTRLISSQAALVLAQAQQAEFESSRLTVPLQKSLKRKTYYMQQAVNLYGQASSYGIPEIATQATYSIAGIYLSFSKALLTSERPKNLSKTELEQYNILLQDKSYPFEDKAIEFYSTNLSHAKDGVYNDWMKKSYAKLKELYPERYSRNVKLEPYINVLQ